MKRFFSIAGLVFVLFMAFNSCAGGARRAPERQVPYLHTKWPFPVGVATAARSLNPRGEEYELIRHFNVLVAENDMKPDAILPRTGPGPSRWYNVDRHMQFAERHGMAVRGHVLIWHSQTPRWFFEGSGPEGRATREELYERMRNHIREVFERYGGRIGWWDVVNEVVSEGGPRAPGMNQAAGQSPFSQIMIDAGLEGMDRYEYVLKAFQWARHYADLNGGENVKLYINDYNIEFAGGKQQELLRLLDWLIENDAPIDGVGLQGHIRYNHPSVTSFRNSINVFSSRYRNDGVRIMTQVTELDISLFGIGEGSHTRIGMGLQHEIDFRTRVQTMLWRQLFDMFEEMYNEGRLDMVLIWGISDEFSWLNDRPRGRRDNPLLFCRDFQPKDAFWALVEDRPTFR